MILEALGAVGTLATFVALMFSAYLGGKRSERNQVSAWRDNFDAEHVKAERLEVAVAKLTEEMSGMSERLARLDEERKFYGGSKTYDTTLEVLAELKKINANMDALLTETKNGNGKEH